MIEEPFNTTEFSFEDLTEDLKLQYFMMLILFISYLVVICGNFTIIVVIWVTPNMHTPMYIFLMNLSIIDIASTSNILPKLLYMLITKYNIISFWECIAQLYVFLLLSCTEVVLLTAMAYDRYVAICHPLIYVSKMSIRHCAGHLVTAWTFGFLNPIGYIALISKMSYCTSHGISHIFCDIAPLLKISCSGVSEVEMLNYIEGTMLGFITFLFTLISYIFIISAILNINSATGRSKAFSTCSSHLTCIILFYVTITSLHMQPTSSYSSKQDKWFSLVYAVLVPMLNPFIYSLKNKDVKKVLLKLKKKWV
ncbi:olfactory receptor 5AR1-like [Pseudophryne corroboree]|uniref:olfactory receptor 5AR1-like n=1 Tax=Pseudophryne corroboree TaxID=495146 RepID=UPI0030819FE4